jgi:hypothetical protein
MPQRLRELRSYSVTSGKAITRQNISFLALISGAITEPLAPIRNTVSKKPTIGTFI